MTVPLGVIAGGLFVAALVLLAARRPFLARLGVREAVRRPKQLALIAVGLMVSTAVVAGAAVTRDSMLESLHAAALRRLAATDVVAQPIMDEPMSASLVDEILRDSAVANRKDAHATALAWGGWAVHEANQLGEPHVLLVGVDPGELRALGAFVPTAGTAPGSLAEWAPDRVVLNAELAQRLSAKPGDAISLYTRALARDSNATQDAPELASTQEWNNATFNGTLVAATRDPTGAYFHSTQDQFEFSQEVPLGAFRLEAFAAGPDGTPVDLDLEALDPDGEARLNNSGSPTAPDAGRMVVGGADLVPGNWIFRIHSKAAVNVNVRLEVHLLVPAQSLPIDLVTIFASDGEESPRIELRPTVAAVLADDGLQPLAEGPLALLPRGLLQTLLGFPSGVNVILVSANPTTSSADLATDLRRTSLRLTAGNTDSQSSDESRGLSVEDARTQALQDAKMEADGTQMFFLMMGSFSILAGLLLIVSLVAMLVDERKTQLATLRAVGATRIHLTELHLHEGFLYALAAALVGLAAGLGLARMLVYGANHLSFIEGGSITVHLKPLTLLASAGLGIAMTLVVIALATLRLSRFHIARGLRGEEEAPRGYGWRTWTLYGLIGAAGGIATLAGLLAGNAAFLILGPPLLVLALAGLAVRRFSRGRIFPIAGLFVLGYLAATFFLLKDLEEDVDFLLIPVRGFLLTIAATLIFVYWGPLARGASAVAARVRGLRAVAAPAFSYPQRRRGRTALTVAMVGLVILMLVLTSSVYAMFGTAVTQGSAGFDVFAVSPDRVDDPRAYLADHPPKSGADPLVRVRDLASLPRSEGLRVRVGEVQAYSWSGPVVVLGATADLARLAQFELDAALPGIRTAADALSRVAREDASAVVTKDLRYWNDGGRQARPGDVITLGEDAVKKDLTVVAVLNQSDFGVVYAPSRAVLELDPQAGTLWLIHATSGADSTQVAREVEAGFLAAGFDATAFDDLANARRQEVRLAQNLVQVFVGLGLLIGVASIGIITARNVIERRREIGTLRAIGATSGSVLGLFVLEVAYVMTLGALIGLGGGILVAYGVWLAEFRDFVPSFAIDWSNLLLLFAVAYIVAIAAALVPARGVARVPPAQATRYAE